MQLFRFFFSLTIRWRFQGVYKICETPWNESTFVTISKDFLSIHELFSDVLWEEPASTALIPTGSPQHTQHIQHSHQVTVARKWAWPICKVTFISEIACFDRQLAWTHKHDHRCMQLSLPASYGLCIIYLSEWVNAKTMKFEKFK